MHLVKTLTVFAVVGPLGVGKTTLLINTISALVRAGTVKKETCAYIVNDDGRMVDGGILDGIATVLPMTNGCFTCSDEAELREQLRTLQQNGYEWVFLEGFGMTSGSEMREFLNSAGYVSRIFALIDFRHYKQNLVRYADVVKSHVASATAGIGITKYPEDVGNILDLERRSDILDFISENRAQAPVFLIPPGAAVPLELLTKSRTVSRRHACTHHHESGCGCHAHHHHDHGHHDGPVHGYVPHWHQVASLATFENLRAAFAAKPQDIEIVRIKGAVAGLHFDAIFEDWQQTYADPRAFVTFYATREVDVWVEMPQLARLLVSENDPVPGQGSETATSYQMLRKDMNRDDTVAAIQQLLSEIPGEPIRIPSGTSERLITHPEMLQLAKEIARRPNVIDEWFPVVLGQCLAYWVACGEYIRLHQDRILPRERATNLRELGISMCWWIHAYGDRFDPRLVARAKALRPGEMVAQGVQSLRSLNSDPEKAKWQVVEIKRAAEFALAHGEDGDIIAGMLEKLESLEGRPVAVH